MKYAVMFEIELGQWDYVRENRSMFTAMTPVQVFNSYAEAQAEADSWNTGRVVEWVDERE